MGTYRQFRLKVPAPCKQKKIFLQQSFSPDSGAPYTPKVSIPSWVVSKEAVMKDPMYLPIHWCLQEQMELTVKDAPRHIWSAVHQEPAHCLLLHGSLQNNRSPQLLQLRDRPNAQMGNSPETSGKFLVRKSQVKILLNPTQNLNFKKF